MDKLENDFTAKIEDKRKNIIKLQQDAQREIMKQQQAAAAAQQQQQVQAQWVNSLMNNFVSAINLNIKFTCAS